MVSSWLVGLVTVCAVAVIARLSRTVLEKRARPSGLGTIIAFGCVYGLVLGLLIDLTMAWADGSASFHTFLIACGVAATIYLGYEPAPVDHERTSQQIAGLAGLVYLAVTGGWWFFLY